MTDLDGRYELHQGIHVLRLEGSWREMGWQHGALLREAIPRGPLPHFRRYVADALADALGPRAARVAGRLLRETVGRRISWSFPPWARGALEGLADGAGLTRREVMDAAVMPESWLWVIKRAMDMDPPPVAPATGGCTSALAWGAATDGGGLLHGRNFDYQGVGAWDAEQAVVFCRPDDGQPFVSVVAAGILFGGVTAMNASGLTLGIHQHMGCDAFKLGGTPTGIAGDDLIRHATDLDEAEAILDRYTPCGCWTYVVGSAREGAVLCYEVTPKGRAALRLDGETAAYSNAYRDPDMAVHERLLYPAHWRNSLCRLERTQALLEQHRGAIDGDVISSILGDMGEDGCHFERAIRMIVTTGSVVFAPDQDRLWVGTGAAPTSTRPYAAFSFSGQGPLPEAPALTGGVPEPSLAAAFDHYREAYLAMLDRHDAGEARRHLAKALDLQPTETLFHYLAGLLALREGDLPAARASLERAIELGHFERERVAALHLWLGRVLDAAGDRAGARREYGLARRGSHRIREAAGRGLGKPWRAKRFSIDFNFADVPTP